MVPKAMVARIAITVRFLTRRYIGEYSSDSEVMYQHNTTVDHAPASLQLLDVTTMQTPYQILNHLSWAHAFVIVYDITSRTSFIHARQLLHILHSGFHTPHHSTKVSPQISSCKISKIGAYPNTAHRSVRNGQTVKDGRPFNTRKEISQPVLSSRGTPKPLQSLHNLTPPNHHVFRCLRQGPKPTGCNHFHQSSLPISSQGRQKPVTCVWNRTQEPVINNFHPSGTSFYDCPCSATLCHCHGPYTAFRYNTTLDKYKSKHSRSSLIHNNVYYDTPDVLLPDHSNFDHRCSKDWSSDRLEPTQLGLHWNFDSGEERQKSGCIYESYTTQPSFYHSHNRFPSHAAALSHQDGLPPRESGFLGRHTTLLLGNKRDLEHIRRVWTDEGEALSLEFSCQFYEVSAAESVVGIHLAFNSLLKETRALQLIRNLPHGSSQVSSRGTVSSAVSKVISNLFRVGKVGHKRQSNSI